MKCAVEEVHCRREKKCAICRGEKKCAVEERRSVLLRREEVCCRREKKCAVEERRSVL